MKNLIIILIALLFVLHQDVWWWDDRTLLLGFLPVGLAYHALYSVLAGLVWWLASQYAWPHSAERFAEGDDPNSERGSTSS